MNMTKEERDSITAYADSQGLDGRLASLCQDTNQVDMLYRLQQEMDEYSEEYRHYLSLTPKDKTREYEAAIAHAKALEAYLYDTEQYEALAALCDVRIRPHHPRAQAFKAKMRKYLEDEIESMSKTYKKQAITLLLNYL